MLESPQIPDEEKPEQDREVFEGWFKTYEINLPVLSGILARYLRKSGAAEPYPELSFEKMRPERGLSALALTNQETGEIRFNISAIESYLISFKSLVDTQEGWPEEDRVTAMRSFFHFIFIETLVHESTHASSKTGYASMDPARYMQMLRGFRTVHVESLHAGEPTINELNAALNEAVTEKIAQEIYAEYAHTVGDGPLARYGEALSEKFKEAVGQRGEYDNAVDTLNIVIKHLSEESGQDPDVIWGGIKREYFTRESSINAFFNDISRFMHRYWPEMALAGVESDAWNPQVIEDRLRQWKERGEKIRSPFRHILKGEEEESEEN